MSTRILVADDEESIRLVLRTLFEGKGYEVHEAGDGEEALALARRYVPDFVVTDVRMPGLDGLELTAALREQVPSATVIVMSAYGSVQLALKAIEAGAHDYVSKPFHPEEVLFVLRKAEERERLRRENQTLRRALLERHRVEGMVGRSEPMQRLFRLVEKAAAFPTTVLVTGESGVGKELVARALHREGPRARKPFVAVNCGAIPEALLESELFGHVRGAFTGAHADHKGLFEAADGGTLFLDEIGELPFSLQVKLLRVLQEGTIRPVGGSRDREVDVRVVAATVRDLAAEVAAGRFREDLLYRLDVLRIHVPPLRERKEDVPLLVEHFLSQFSERFGVDLEGVSPKALRALLAYPWPGNVRELENVLERAVVLADGPWITIDELPDRLREPSEPVQAVLQSGELSIKKAVRFIEAELIRRALEETGGNRTHAAKLLEISHRALLYKMKAYGVR